MSGKRSYLDLDPDYEDVSLQQSKRQRCLEQDAKEATVSKIQDILRKQFAIEISNKELEILNISEKLECSRRIIDRLRACIVASYYGNTTQQKLNKSSATVQPPLIHPIVKRHLGKHPKHPTEAPPVEQNQSINGDALSSEIENVPEKLKGSEIVGRMTFKQPAQEAPTVSRLPKELVIDSRTGRFKVKKRIIVGNVSKNIPADRRDENDQASHKWMVYVRGSKEEPRIDHYVKKVWFFLHPSYRPNDLVEVSQHPFHLTRRGWGEFPVRVQLHFKDQRNKRVDVIHNLKLDRTYTGLQTLGSETVVDIELERDIEELKREKERSFLLTADIKKEYATTAFAHLDGGVTVKEEVDTEHCGIAGNDLTSDHNQMASSIQMPLIKTEPIDSGYGDKIVELQGHSGSEKVSCNNNKENSGSEKQRTASSGLVSVSVDGKTGTPFIQNLGSAFPLVKSDGSIVLAVSSTGAKKGDLIQGAGGVKIVPTQNMLGTVKHGSMGVTSTQNVQFVLKGLGSLGASQLGGASSLSAGTSITLSPVTSVSAVAPSTPPKNVRGQTSGMKASPKSECKTVKPSTTTSSLVLTGNGSFTRSSVSGSSADSTIISQLSENSVTQPLTASSTTTVQSASASFSLQNVKAKASVSSYAVSSDPHVVSKVGVSATGKQSPSPGKLSSSAPIVLQGLGSLSALNANNVSSSSSTSATSKTGSKACTVSQSQMQTGLQTSPLASASTGNKSGTQSNQSKLVFLQCTDNQGKTYLIPQQLYTSLPQEKSKAGNSVYQMRSSTQTNQSPSVASPKNPPHASGKFPGSIQTPVKLATTSLTAVPVSSSPSLVNINLNQMTAMTGLQSKGIGNQQQVNAPIIYIKPDTGTGNNTQGQTGTQVNSLSQAAQLVNLNKGSPVHSGAVRLVTPAQIHGANTLKKAAIAAGVQGESSSTCKLNNVRGQLKVTSQGLINVVKPNISLAGSASVTNSVKPVNGNIAGLNSTKQPFMIVPSTKQVSLLPGRSQTTVNTSIAKGMVSLPSLTTGTESQRSRSTSSSIVTTATVSGPNMQNKVMNLPTSKVGLVQNNCGLSDTVIMPTGLAVPNSKSQLVIIPVSSTATQVTSSATRTSTSILSSSSLSSSSTLSSVSSMSSLSSLSSSSLSLKMASTSTSNGSQDGKTMYIVVQGDKTESKVEGQSMSGGQFQGHLQPRQTVSLLKTSSLQADMLQQNDPSVAWKRHRSSGEASPQVVVVSKGDKSVSVMGSSLLTKSILKPYRGEPEKKIIKTGPKKPKPKEEDLKQKIRALRPDGHCSLQSLIQAAVMSHPIIAADVATHLHPYCARSKEDWLSWNVGKRRASEWHRASSVRKFIIQHLGGITMFKGEKLWSTKQILVWCRHHAYSPHYLEKTLHPTAVDLQSEHSLPSNRQRKYKSVSCADVLLSDVLMSPDRHRANTECESDEEVEIVSLELPKAKVKVEPEETEEVYIQEYLPVSDEAKFVQNTTHQMGMKYGPVEVDDGYYGNMSEDIVYRAMQSFMSDILRETFSLKVNVGRYPDGLGISDVYSSLQSMSTADFITNKYLGVPEDKTVPTAYR